MTPINLENLFRLLKNLEIKFKNKINIDYDILDEFFLKAENSITKFKETDVFIIASIITFWISRLKPFYFITNKNQNPYLYLNEIIGILFGYNYIIEKEPNKEKFLISTDFITKMSNKLRYSNLTISSISLIYETIYNERVKDL